MSTDVLSALASNMFHGANLIDRNSRRFSRSRLIPGLQSNKKVHFEAIPRVSSTHSRENMSEEEIENCWWSAEEQEQIKRRAAALVATAADTYPNFLRKTLHRAFDLVLSSHLTERCSIPPGQLEVSKHMNRWVFQCAGLRGLENSSLSHPYARMLIAEHRRMILSCTELNASDKIVREVSLQISASSARLARLMAVADELMECTAVAEKVPCDK
jgi:hypothetical protein